MNDEFIEVVVEANSAGGHSWLSTIMTLSLVVVIILIGIVIGRRVKNGEHISLSHLFTHRVKDKLEIAAAISTGGEVIALALLAIDRDVEPFSAFIRYFLIGFVELTFTFIFLNLSTSLQKSIAKSILKDGIFHWKESLWVFPYILLMIPLFIFCSIPTYIILQLYYESIGVLKFAHNPSWNPFEQLILSENYEDVHPELGAIVLIVFTPLLNLLQLVLNPMSIWKEKDKLFTKSDDFDDYDDDDDDEEEDEDPVGMTLYDAIKHLKDIIYWDPVKVKEKLDEVLGRGGMTGLTHPEIKNGTKTSAEIESWLSDVIVGDDDDDDPIGVLGYMKIADSIRREKAELDSVVEDIEEVKREIAATSDPDDLEALEEKKTLLDEKKTKIRQNIGKLTDINKDVAKTLEKVCKQAGLKP